MTTTALSDRDLTDQALDEAQTRIELISAGSELTIPYLLVGSSEFDVEGLRRPMLELVDDHPDRSCRCGFPPASVQRGYPHHLIPAAQPVEPKPGSRAGEVDA